MSDLSLALGVDLLFGEPPPRLHPVRWMGGAIERARRTRAVRTRGRTIVQGAVHLMAGAVACGAAGAAMDRLLRPSAVARAAALTPFFSLRALLDAAGEVEAALRRGDLPGARANLSRHLVSRDTRRLTGPEVAAAAIASLAENLNDSVVAPLLYARAAGLGGAAVYRWVNTADAMLGYRTAGMEAYGKAAARLDDGLNLLPARLAAAALCLAAPLAGGSAAGAARIALRDHGRTPSPNGGWTMSAMAGALGVRIEKAGLYALNAEGRPADASDLAAASRLVGLASLLTAALLSR